MAVAAAGRAVRSDVRVGDEQRRDGRVDRQGRGRELHRAPRMLVRAGGRPVLSLRWKRERPDAGYLRLRVRQLDHQRLRADRVQPLPGHGVSRARLGDRRVQDQQLSERAAGRLHLRLRSGPRRLDAGAAGARRPSPRVDRPGGPRRQVLHPRRQHHRPQRRLRQLVRRVRSADWRLDAARGCASRERSLPCRRRQRENLRRRWTTLGRPGRHLRAAHPRSRRL